MRYGYTYYGLHDDVALLGHHLCAERGVPRVWSLGLGLGLGLGLVRVKVRVRVRVRVRVMVGALRVRIGVRGTGGLVGGRP